MKKLWVDRDYTKYLSSLIYVAYLVFVLWTGMTQYDKIKPYAIIIIGFILLLGLYYFISLWITKPTVISIEGIYVGDIPNDTYALNLFTFKRKATFLEWKDIKSIKILNREMKHNFMLVLKPFLIVQSKNDKEYESFIAQPKGFVQVLKELKRSNLISKDSKFND